jgi:hypothetical protein
MLLSWKAKRLRVRDERRYALGEMFQVPLLNNVIAFGQGVLRGTMRIRVPRIWICCMDRNERRVEFGLSKWLWGDGIWRGDV